MEDRSALLVRLPSALKAEIELCAKQHLRSANKECVLAIQRHVAALSTGDTAPEQTHA